MAAHLPTHNRATVRITREMKLMTTQALYATLLVQSKPASALVDSGSSASLFSWHLLQSLGISCALEVYK